MIGGAGVPGKHLENDRRNATDDNSRNSDSYQQLNHGKTLLVFIYRPKPVKHQYRLAL
jgi:hypothetical protein